MGLAMGRILLRRNTTQANNQADSLRSALPSIVVTDMSISAIAESNSHGCKVKCNSVVQEACKIQGSRLCLTYYH